MAFWDKLLGKGKNKKPERQEKDNSQNERTPIIHDYISGLRAAYFQNNGVEEWEYFEKVIHGAQKGNIDRVRNAFPETPSALIDLSLIHI